MKVLVTFLTGFILANTVNAQDLAPTASKNILKVSATNLVFMHFDFQYERILSGHWSAAFAFRFLPMGKFPFQNTLERDVNTGNKMSDFDRDNFTSSSYSLTPEVRYYLGNEAGKKFYIGAFARYSKYTAKDFNLNYMESSSSMVVVPIGGSFNTYSAGLVVGSQFSLGKNFTLDCFLGGHLGRAQGNLSADYATLTPSQQVAIQGLLDGIQLKHMSEKAVHPVVGSNQTRIDINGPWEAFRGGISLGYKF